MWEETDLISFTDLEKNRVMDLMNIITHSSKYLNISAHVGWHFGQSCKVVAHTITFIMIYETFDSCCGGAIRTISLQQLSRFSIGLDLCATLFVFSCTGKHIFWQKQWQKKWKNGKYKRDRQQIRLAANDVLAVCNSIFWFKIARKTEQQILPNFSVVQIRAAGKQ